MIDVLFCYISDRILSARAIVSLITVLCIDDGGTEISALISSIRYDPFFFDFRFFRKTEMPISRSNPEMIRSYRARYIQGCVVAQRSRLSVITRFNECESTSFWLLLLLEVLAIVQWRDVTCAIHVLAINTFTFLNHNNSPSIATC